MNNVKNIKKELDKMSRCSICGFKLAKIEDSTVKWEGHYSSPDGLFCIECWDDKEGKSKKPKKSKKKR